MATEEDTETREILVTAPRRRTPTLRTYSRKRSNNKLPSLKPSQKQFPAKPLQQAQLNLRVTKRLSDVSKTADQPFANSIEVILPGNASFDSHDSDDAYVGGDEEEGHMAYHKDVADNDEQEKSENDDEIPNTTRKKSHTVFVPLSAGPGVYSIPDGLPNDLPDNNKDQKENHTKVVIPATAPRFTQRLVRGRPPGNGPRRPHLIFNKLPARNRFKKLPQAGSKKQTSALRSHPGDGFSDDELKRSGLVLLRSGKPTTSDTYVGELDISRAPPLPKHKRDRERVNLDDNPFDIRPRKKIKHLQEQAIVIPDEHQPDQDPSSSTKPNIPKKSSQSILRSPRSQPSHSSPPRKIPTQILIPALRQNNIIPRNNLTHRAIIHPPTSDEDQSEEDSACTPDDEITLIPKSSDSKAQPEGEEEQQDNGENSSSGYEMHIPETSSGRQRSSSVPIEKNQMEDSSTVEENAGAGVQVTRGLAGRRELKRSTTR
ncbi:hypothetical protein QBC36DRAFT_303047 [Triangularia setosa]|uniref:Uncharacterized protein n=1 Tax=Triangularia setosa TaxID=2587417 RepID=A0AAN6W3D5_9PEZI|nr:hypothetical protein QBC36DRAFT_303047 [Podospora setosa]